ncbi:hypothetical protein OBBRIDRAFT_840318 [Obba rivulosa]|uniref:Uncharacterized protein n=1 Tax=Obba rivulosa TaxID=1052685 RepID=A0A8E2AFR7_9APHY|nr:hypothetical protein OBBRIDRAFT_840318 [Obba rivulosa]
MSRAGSHPLSRAGRSDAPQHASTSGSMYSNQRISADLARLTATHGGATSIPVAIGIAPSETINARASPIEPGTPQRHLTINIEPPTSQYRGGQDGPQFTFLAPNIAPLNPEEHRHMMELLPPSSPLAEDDDAVGSPDNALEDGHSDVSLDDILDAEHILEQPEKIRKYSVNANSEPQIDEEKQKMRRIAGERRKKIIQEVLAVDDLFKNIADNHGVHPEQVRAIWGNLHRRGRHRKSNLWTLYQVYHSTFSEQECRRWLKPDADGKIEVSDNRDAVSRCFEGFKNHYKDRENVMWDILSTTYDMNLLLHGKGRTVGGHKRMFTEWSHEISSQLLLGHKQNGFESVLIAGGGSTFQDDSLGVVWESPGAEGVLQRIFGTSDKSVILGHLRAQGMMYNSQQANVNVRGGEMMNIAGPSNTATEVPVDVANPSNVVDASGTGDAQEAFKSPQISATELAVPGAKATKDDVLKYLRTRFIDLILTAKGEEIQPNATVPWTTAYPQLRDGNLIIENWPEDVPYPKPGDKKGIAVLSGLERQRLLHAFLDTEYPLRCVPGGHLNKANPTNYLAIVGVPPKSSSIHTGGLRVWYSKLNAKVWGDFHGAPRLKRVHPMPADFNGDNDSSKPPITIC